MPPKRQQPNVDDPLSEGTPQRRLWAAYLKAGFTRATFARAVGVAYHTLDAWDTGRSTPDLANFATAAVLVGFTADELLFGHGGMTAQGGVESALSTEGVRTLLDQIRATPAQVAALAKHRQSTGGMFARFTPTYVRVFVAAYASHTARGEPHAAAVASSAAEAQHTLATLDAHARGVQGVLPADAASLAPRVKARLRGDSGAQPTKQKRGGRIKRAPARTKPHR